MITIDDATDPLAILAADRTAAGPARSRCAEVWPLLVVTATGLDPDDRLAIESHLATCARCRTIAIDTWLDGAAPVDALAEAPPEAPVEPPPVTAAPPVVAPPRRSRGRLAAGLGLVALAAALVVALAVRPRGPRSQPAPTLAPGATTPGLAVVLVYLGTEVWIGNDRYVDPSPPPPPEGEPVKIRKVYGGAHDDLRRALDELATALPPGSLVGLVAMDLDGPRTVRPLVSAAGLRADALGDQRAYEGRIGYVDHAVALGRAGALLAAVPQQRRLIVVASNGCDLEEHRGTAAIAAARARLAAAGVEVRALDLASPDQLDCPATFAALDPAARHLASAAELPDAVRAMITAAPHR